MNNNKRIAKNTLMLYFRMMLIMGVTLYTSRIVLEVLGVEDFGIYNIVGGVIVMLGFLNSAMSTATQRFISFELGRKDEKQLKKVFSLSVTIHAIIAVFVLFLAETIGLWFLNNKLIIPVERMSAANWVYQFSILAFMVNIMAVPYNAAIISHERMNVYAYVSIVEVFLKLLIVFVLQWFGFDKLALYSILIFVVSFVIQLIYRCYCKWRFEECTYQFVWDRNSFQNMFGFAGWNLFASFASITLNQGIAFLLNIFFGPILNTANAIALQINGAVTQFISNLQTSMNPQIIKYYATDEKLKMNNLVMAGSRYSFFLFFLFSLPILFHSSYFLSFWLNQVPEYAAQFTQLILINSCIHSLSNTLYTASQATGKNKFFVIVVGSLLILNLPIAYIILHFTASPTSIFIIMIIISIISLQLRLYMLNKLILFPLFDFYKKVVLRSLFIAFLSVSSVYFACNVCMPYLHPLVHSILTLLITFIFILSVGLTSEERIKIKVFIKSLLKKTTKLKKKQPNDC